MSKYDEMKAYYDRRIEELKNEVQFWREKSIIRAVEHSSNKNANEEIIKLYEKILDKFMDIRRGTTDELFMFEGKCYCAANFNLERNRGEIDTLTVEFYECYPFCRSRCDDRTEKKGERNE